MIRYLICLFLLAIACVKKKNPNWNWQLPWSVRSCIFGNQEVLAYVTDTEKGNGTKRLFVRKSIIYKVVNWCLIFISNKKGRTNQALPPACRIRKFLQNDHFNYTISFLNYQYFLLLRLNRTNHHIPQLTPHFPNNNILNPVSYTHLTLPTN